MIRCRSAKRVWSRQQGRAGRTAFTGKKQHCSSWGELLHLTLLCPVPLRSIWPLSSFTKHFSILLLKTRLGQPSSSSSAAMNPGCGEAPVPHRTAPAAFQLPPGSSTGAEHGDNTSQTCKHRCSQLPRPGPIAAALQEASGACPTPAHSPLKSFGRDRASSNCNFHSGGCALQAK